MLRMMMEFRSTDERLFTLLLLKEMDENDDATVNEVMDNISIRVRPSCNVKSSSRTRELFCTKMSDDDVNDEKEEEEDDEEESKRKAPFIPTAVILTFRTAASTITLPRQNEQAMELLANRRGLEKMTLSRYEMNMFNVVGAIAAFRETVSFI